MPIYLCNPGEGQSEPWKFHVHVYAAPYDVDAVKETQAAENPTTTTTTGRISSTTTTSTSGGGATSEGNAQVRRRELVRFASSQGSSDEADTSSPTFRNITNAADNGRRISSFTNNNSTNNQLSMIYCTPVRRVRHAEVVLVDDVCIAYDHYWLRLRWPGNKGGFAGYIQMGRTSDYNDNYEVRLGNVKINMSKIRSTIGGSEDRGMTDDTDQDDPARDDNIATPPSEPYDLEITDNTLACSRTGLIFPSSGQLKLLAMYDDGIAPRVTLAPFPTEQIFCRICREGLHEDADTEQPNAATEDADNTNRDTSVNENDNSNNNNNNNTNDDDEADNDDGDEGGSIKASEPYTVGPVLPHPQYITNTDALQNPMLAPCECAGSMAFVHYMCVEQWRCRSRHPHAHNGLNCETCGKPYALPPPLERQDVQLEHEDWLDAMPPHVMQALRQPHIWWQLGAAIVRRRWLRPLAPIFMSPLVALYCRARRLLKKRGVARRRWACSLCRRRARWKCVRCLRSYYCSRQCQNVSWHIIHKHVCYKPIRFWWSVVVYGAIALLLFPGILRDPLMYDLGVCLIPVSFVIMGVLGGGIASILKRIAGVDIRGRLLELVAVVSTLWLCLISWGLVRGFFGATSACYGSFGTRYNLTKQSIATSYSILRPFHWAVLKPAEKMYIFWDRLPLKFFWSRLLFCAGGRSNIDTLTGEQTGCFEHTPHANADFIFYSEDLNEGGDKCAADLYVVFSLYVLAGVAFAGSSLLKHQERQRRRQLRHHRPVLLQPPANVRIAGGGALEARPHQD